MSTLEDIPFETPLGSLGQDVCLMTPPDISVPDCLRIMQETQVTSRSRAYPNHFTFAITASNRMVLTFD